MVSQSWEVALAVYLLWGLVAYPLQISEGDHGIVYLNRITTTTLVAVLYVTATCGALFFSRFRPLVLLAWLNFVGLLVVMVVKRYEFTSLWCAYAAVLSVIIISFFTGAVLTGRPITQRKPPNESTNARTGPQGVLVVFCRKRRPGNSLCDRHVSRQQLPGDFLLRSGHLGLSQPLAGVFCFRQRTPSGVAAFFSFEHHLHIWWLVLCESCFALLLGVYIGISLLLTPQSLAFLAGIHAVGNGCFQAALAIKLRDDRLNLFLLASAGVISLGIGLVFLTHYNQAPRVTAQL